MSKKYLLPATICLGVTLLLSACSAQDEISPESVPSQESTVQESQSSEVVVEKTSNLPKVVINNEKEYRYAPGEEVVLVESSTDRVSLTGEGFEEAAATVEKLFAGQTADVDNLASIAKDDYEYSKTIDQDYFYPYTIDSTCKISRLDESILSIKRWNYEYSGGAHGNYTEYGTTVDLKTGEELELIDLAVDSYGLIDICTRYVLDRLAERGEELFPEYEVYVDENLQNCSWYMDASGIEFVFSPYEIAPYASGSIIVCVPYSQVSTYMKPEYCGLHGEYITMVGLDSEVSFVSDEIVRTLKLENRVINEYEYNTVIVLDDKEYPLENYVYVDNAYLMHRPDGKVFLLYSIDWASDDYETYVYDLTGDDFTQTASVWAQINSRNITLDSLSLTFTLQVLGTHTAEMEYIITEDGRLEPSEKIYNINAYSGWSGLTTIKELPVILDGEQTMLPVGTRLYVTATDNDGTVWFETTTEKGDLKTGEIHYVRDAESYTITIDGVSEFDYFESIPYAG